MNNLRNRVQLIGHLGATPEVRNLDGGKKIAKVSIAINENYKDAKGNLMKDTSWHTLVLWNQKAVFAEKYMQKGAEVAIEGKLVTRSYESKEGDKRFVTEIVVNEVLLMGGAGNAKS